MRNIFLRLKVCEKNVFYNENYKDFNLHSLAKLDRVIQIPIPILVTLLERHLRMRSKSRCVATLTSDFSDKVR